MTVETAVETRIPMSWEEYEVYDAGDYRCEYFGGHAVIYGFPSRVHQRICYEVAKLLEDALPERAEMTLGWGWVPDGVRESLVPDVMVHRSDEIKRLTATVPLLVVEVMSSNRSTDLVDKLQRYARWGAASYWIIDPRDHELTTYDLVDGIYVASAVHRTGTVVAAYSDVDVEIDLDHLLR